MQGQFPKFGEAFGQTTTVPLTRSSIKLSAELIEAFVKEFLAQKYDNPLPTPIFHKEMWEIAADELYPHALFLAPRGHAKSTSITEAYGMTALLFRQRDFAVIISNTVGQSIEFLEDFKTELLTNDKIREEFEIHKFLRDREDDIIVQMKDGHKFRVVAKGSEQKVRGLKWNKRRPNLIICDDLEDDEQVMSKERRDKFSKWFMRAVLPFGSDDCLFRVAATILHFDSLAENLSKDESWKTKRYRAHKSFSDFTNILWPEKFSEERLKGIQAKYLKKNDRDGYSQEYLNYPIAEGHYFFRKEDLLPMEEHHKHIPMRKYAAWDFAISKKQDADFTVCVVLGVDDRNNYYVIDVRRGKWDGLEIIDEMFSVQKAHKCDVHWAEGGQIEKTFGAFLYAEMLKRSLDPKWAETAIFTVEPVTPTLDKVSRARGWQAKTRTRSVFYDKTASWYPALEEEMERFPKGEHDDQIDPQSLLGMQLATGILPEATEAEKEEEIYHAKTTQTRLGVNAFTGY